MFFLFKQKSVYEMRISDWSSDVCSSDLLGHNKYLGWTNTVNRPDLIDVYRLTLDDSGDNYRFDGAWRPLEEKRIWLKVKFGPFVVPVPRTIWRSVHGPVVKNDKGAFAIRYAGIDQANMVTQYYRLNKAEKFAAWRAAMAGQGVPATNFIYADAKGNRSEEHTSELQSLMRISYAVFCLKK